MSTSLATSERTQLESLERTVSAGLGNIQREFIDVGEALLEINSKRLYRQGFSSFEAYCENKWGLSRAHAYRMIQAAKVSPMGDIPNERQARELAKVPPPDRQKVIEHAGPAPTAAKIAKAREVIDDEKTLAMIRRDEAAAAGMRERAAHRERIEAIEAKCAQLRKLHAGLDVADKADFAMDTYEKIIARAG